MKLKSKIPSVIPSRIYPNPSSNPDIQTTGKQSPLKREKVKSNNIIFTNIIMHPVFKLNLSRLVDRVHSIFLLKWLFAYNLIYLQRLLQETTKGNHFF